MSTETPSPSSDFHAPAASSAASSAARQAAPPAPLHALRVGQYYRTDSSRLSFTELWRDTRSPLVLLAWLFKLLRIRGVGSANDPNVVSLRPFVVADQALDESIPAVVRQQLEPVVRELANLGFHGPVYFAIHDLLHHSRTCQVALLHRDGHTVARVTHRAEGVQLTKIHFFTEFLSVLRSATFLHSTSAPAQLLVPAQCRLNWNHRATTSQLWVSHRRKLEEAGLAADPAIELRGREDMVDALERHHEAVRDFQLERGVFSSMEGEDLARAEALERNLAQARSGQMRHPEIMVHLERLQQKQTSWTNAILVLIVSIALFVGAGAGTWQVSAEILMMIVGVLLVHEAGHYLAMKIFNYRNVRMFFIPFLGAAVSGRHYTAPGWKKVIVALMGPLPGIFLGGVLGIAGLIKGNTALTKVATMAVILNGFQLLPVEPLDGGRIMHALLFCRHHYLDTAFRILAVGALVGIGALADDKVLLYLGVFMLLTTPTAYKVARMAAELRRLGFGPSGATPAASSGLIEPGPAYAPGHLAGTTPLPVSTPAPPTVPFPPVPGPTAPSAGARAAEQAIPGPVAEAIIDRIRIRFPRFKAPRAIAQMTLQVYETLAMRPPGIAASIGFAFLHGASFLLALVLLVVLVAPQSPQLMRLLRANAANPTRTIEPDAITSWPGASALGPASSDETASATAPADPAAGEREAIVATFASVSEARRAFADAKPEAPVRATLVHFGQSVLLSFPTGDESVRARWFAEFERRTPDVFVDGGGDSPASLTLTCQASSSARAKEIREQLSTVLKLPVELYLIPPWAGADVDRRPPDERARHNTALAMFCKLQSAYVEDAPELDALDEDMNRAARRNDRAEYQRLTRQRIDVENRLRMLELERLRDGAADPLERDLANRYIAIEVDAQRAEQVLEEEPQASGAPPASRPAAAPSGEEGTGEATESDDESDESISAALARQRDELGPLMGQLPLAVGGERPLPGALRYSTRFGYTSYAGGKKLSVHVSFADVAQGAPALLQWLHQQGCRDFKYEFQSLGYYDDEFEE